MKKTPNPSREGRDTNQNMRRRVFFIFVISIEVNNRNLKRNGRETKNQNLAKR
jgi:hypothetical protein